MGTQLETKTSQQVSESNTLGEVKAKFPQAAEVLSKYGVDSGASAPLWETLEQTAKRYNLDDDTFKKLLTELNEGAVPPSPESSPASNPPKGGGGGCSCC